MTNIGEGAFESCSNLQAIYFLGNAPGLGAGAFANDPATVYFETGTIGWATNFGGLPMVELYDITYTVTPTNGTGPLTVSFTASIIDSGYHPISSWNWNFGDGSASTAQNPSHTYLTADTFYPVLIATNNAGQLILGRAPPAVAVSPPQPALGGLSFSAGNLTIPVSNGFVGATYCVLTSTNLGLPLSQWTPLTTNVLSASGDFTIAVANPASQSIPQQFYTIQCHGSVPPTNVVISIPTGPQPGLDSP